MKNIDKHTFNGFNYIKGNDSHDTLARIEHNKQKPKNIFKFYAFSEYSVDALIKGYFYASHPFELNDCLDSNSLLMFASKPIPYSSYKSFLGELYENDDKLKEYYKKDCTNHYRGYISTLFDVATNMFGIISTTGEENSSLMWPHYTQEKGFQLKFNTQKIEDSIRNKLSQDEKYIGLYPINYSKDLLQIDVSLFQTFIVPVYYTTNVKSYKWKYENEWRFLVNKQNMGVPYSKLFIDKRNKDYEVNKANRYVFYDHELIEEICFGIKFFNGSEFEIEWLDNKNIKVKPKNKKINCHSCYQSLLLDFIVENLSDKFYCSGISHLDKKNQGKLVRTKEKIKISKQKGQSYLLTRTDTIIELPE